MSRKETEKRKADNAFVQQLLDSYFMFRRNLPEQGFIQENKTTATIAYELSDMYNITSETVVEYMLEHGYSTMSEQDGTVRWAIWRQT